MIERPTVEMPVKAPLPVRQWDVERSVERFSVPESAPAAPTDPASTADPMTATDPAARAAAQ